MSLLRKPARPSAGWVAVTVALIALVAAGCSGAATSAGQASHTPTTTPSPPPQTNGLEKKSAADVLYAAAAALKAAKSVHVAGAGRDGGKPVRLDERIQGTRGTGTMELKGAKLRIIKIDKTTYVKTDAQSWITMGMPAAVAPQLAGHWVKMGPETNFNLTGFTVAELAASMTKYDSPLVPKVEQTTLNGKKVVVLGEQNGSKVYVANTGPAYPLHSVGREGQIDFTEYGSDFRITAPTDAIDGATVLRSH